VKRVKEIENARMPGKLSEAKREKGGEPRSGKERKKYLACGAQSGERG